jgi:hypothetical protein
MSTQKALSLAAAAALGLAATAGADTNSDSRAAINSVMREAQQHSQLLAAGDAMAGIDEKGAFIRGDGGELRPGVHAQFRGVLNSRSEAKGGDSDTQTGFEVRRLKLSVEGWAFSPTLKYDIVWQADRNGGAVSLEDFVITYALDGDMAIRAGQYKDPVFHEELTSSKRQLAADRSILNEILGGGVTDRPQGVSLVYAPKDGAFKAEVMMHDGAASRNTNFQDSPGVSTNAAAGAISSANFGVSGRVEFKAMGKWGDYADFSAVNTAENLLVIGGGLDWTQGLMVDSVGASPNADRIWCTVDAQYEMPNPALGVYGALIFDYTSFSNSVGEDSRLHWGFLVQAGWALNKQWEVFGRYNMVKLDKDFVAAGAEDTFHELTFGVNHFLFEKAGHKAKITADVGFLPNGATSGLSGLDILSGTDEQFYVRLQLQVVQ